jgi:TolB-like protein
MAISRAVVVVFLFAAFIPLTTVHAAERQKLAVLDLEAKGVDKATVETLTDIVTVALKKLGVFDVISRADIQQMLNFEESKQLVGCTSSSSCIAEIGGALGVARVVTGSVGKVGTKYVINLSLLDTKSAKVIERESRDASTEEDLVSAAENGARFLVRSLLEGKRGDVIIKVSESSAEVELDGKLVGVSPIARQQMASGPHTVRISKKGFVSFARDIVVDEREPTILDVSMIPSTEFINNYDRVANGVRVGAYLAAGVGVAMVATGAIVREVYNTPRANKADADAKAYNASTAQTKDQADKINAAIDSVRVIDELCLGLMISGSVVAVAGVVLFLIGPKPGVYDAYKTVTVGDAKISFDLAPYKDGGFGSATVRW